MPVAAQKTFGIATVRQFFQRGQQVSRSASNGFPAAASSIVRR
ncbi:hypothetical protein BN439_2636 [Erwinia amylovora Ea644]|nr:hypothetical protein BN439_2636 [Erwinia amylovora Ea644]